MRMMKCPKCGADNSVRREGCFNCGTLLGAAEPPLSQVVHSTSVQPPIDAAAVSRQVPSTPIAVTLTRVGCGGLLAYVMLALLIAPFRPPDPNDEARKVGSRSRLFLRADRIVEADQMMVLAIDEDAFDEMIGSSVAGDVRGISELVLAGRAFMVPQGTTVLVIDMHAFSRKVRVLDGDAAGMCGWLPYEMVVS